MRSWHTPVREHHVSCGPGSTRRLVLEGALCVQDCTCKWALN